MGTTYGIENVVYNVLLTVLFFFTGWHKAYPDVALFNPSPLLDKLVAEGKFGAKSGEGFYKHQK